MRACSDVNISGAANGPLTRYMTTEQTVTSSVTSHYPAPAGSRQLPHTPPVNRQPQQQQQQQERPPVPPPRPPAQHQMSAPPYSTDRYCMWTRFVYACVNPLMGTLKLQSNGLLYSNYWLCTIFVQLYNLDWLPLLYTGFLLLHVSNSRYAC